MLSIIYFMKDFKAFMIPNILILKLKHLVGKLTLGLYNSQPIFFI